MPPRQLEPRVPPDLETICLKCLQKEPAKRYLTAEDLGDDLRRFLDDEPILARPTSAWERAWKWGKRRPAIVALIGLSVATAVALVAFIVWHNVSLAGQLDDARAEERMAREREQRAVEEQRIARLEAEGQRLLHDARVAAAARDWAAARLHLTKALATLGAEPQLLALKEPTEALLAEAEAKLKAEADLEASRDRRRRFAACRDEALFLGCLYTGLDLAANLKATRAAVRKALEVHGQTADGTGRRTSTRTSTPPAGPRRRPTATNCCSSWPRPRCRRRRWAGTCRRPSATPRRSGCSGRRCGSARRRRRTTCGRPATWGCSGTPAGRPARRKRRPACRPATAFDHFLVGEEYFRRGKLAEAGAAFGRVLRAKPADFWAQYLNALCLMRQRKPGRGPRPTRRVPGAAGRLRLAVPPARLRAGRPARVRRRRGRLREGPGPAPGRARPSTSCSSTGASCGCGKTASTTPSPT